VKLRIQTNWSRRPDVSKPRIALIPGDPNGIGPELAIKLLADPETLAAADVLLIGDPHVLAQGQAHAGLPLAATTVGEADLAHLPEGLAHLPTDTIAPADLSLGEATLAGGRSSLRTLDRALDLTARDVADALVFMPFNKAALHLAGLGHEDELHYMAARLGFAGYVTELNVLGGLWTSRVTSHVPLRAVADLITLRAVRDAIDLIERTLRASGLERPRIAVAGLNPHAGDGGNFGREEIEVIGPAVERAKADGLDVTGPWPSDTVFTKAQRGEVDAVVTMYHDQGQIALKLMGFAQGVTVLGGLPVPVATPAHGTAFDIVGKGVASLDAARAAFAIACAMGRRRRHG
jgi:4-hydroxythreonine-4-phosphate dehydrogenase